MAILFNNSGEFMETKWYQVPGIEAVNLKDLRQLDAVEAREVDRCRYDLHLVDDAIHVKRFHLSEVSIGIDDMDCDSQQYVLHPERFDPSDRADLEDTVQFWKETSQYIFYWHNDFWVDMNGDVQSS